MRHYSRKTQDEIEIEDYLLAHGIDVSKVRLFEPLCDGESHMTISLPRYSKPDINLVKELVEEKVGALLDIIHVNDTEKHLLIVLE